MKFNHKGFTVIEVLLIIVIVGLITGIGVYVWYSLHQLNQTYASTSQVAQSSPPKDSTEKAASGAQTAKAAILAPQTVGPVVAECSLQLTKAADGNATPLFCANGGINVLAWQYFGANNFKVMSQGPDATSDQVYAAMCSDTAAGKTTNPIETSSEQLTARYNGWSFGNDSRSTGYIAQC